MKKWMIKAFIQGVISELPNSTRLNYFFQKYVSKSMDLTLAQVMRRLEWCTKHLENQRRYASSETAPAEILELGTGWFPTVPLGMYLCGVKQIHTIDIVQLVRHETLVKALRLFDQAIQTGQINEALPYLLPERALHLQEIAKNASQLSLLEVLRNLNIHYMIGDARLCPLPDQSIELFISNTTLEHISEPILGEIFEDFRRMARPSALMSHLIDMSDHYSHFDRSINSFNFLQYDESRWRLFNNAVHYQNRLRITDYRRIHSAAGFELLAEQNKSGSLKALSKTNVASQFRTIPQDDLLVTSSWMVSRPQP